MIEVYDFGGQRVRTAGTGDRPLFCLVDACSVLDIGDANQASQRIDPDDVELVPVEHASGAKQALFVTESGLYALIFGSRKPQARAFKKWVTSEVLPAIRKTGSYGVPDLHKALSDPATLRRLLGNYAERVEALEGEIATARPKVEVYDRIIDSGDTLGFRDACKLIHAGTGAKETEVREFMIRARWIQRLARRLAPASYGQEKGYVTSRERELPHVTNIDGRPMVVPELRITQRGVTRAIERLLNERAA